MISNALDPRDPIKWESSHLGNSSFVPKAILLSLTKLPHSEKFDFVIISVPNLQSFQTYCSQLEPHVNSESVIVVESTGYVHLEPFVLLSLPKFKTMPVCSIMNESDIKQHPNSNTFYHRVSGNDHRIYFGTSTDEAKAAVSLRDSEPFLRFYKALQTMQEKLEGSLGLLKSINAREFMTYQWKLALPRIVLNPLSVMFEEAYPANLEKQILVKPLISGLVHELFKIIKKMECKLVKGFENETNILKNWLAIYPVGPGNAKPIHSDSNLIFYNFYHQQDMDIDLLLLQPILLGDDHGVKTPYLENLYSMLCQLAKINSSQDSIFFTRKFGSSTQDSKNVEKVALDLSKLKLEKDMADKECSSTRAALQKVDMELTEKRQQYEHLNMSLHDKQAQHEARIKEFSYIELQKERIIAELEQQISEKMGRLRSLTDKVNQASAANIQEKTTSPAEERTSRNGALIPETPDLSEYANLAAYGEGLISTPSNPAKSFNESRGHSNGNGLDQNENEEFHDANLSQLSNANSYMNGLDPDQTGNSSMVSDPRGKQRQNYSAPNMYNNSYDPTYDQRNEMNGQYGPMNQRNLQMYPQGMPQNQPRTSSFNNQYQQQMVPPPLQYRPNSMPLQQMAGNGQYYPGGVQGQNFHQKKQGRRSAFTDQVLNIDYGGRGGMPMPNSGSKQRPNVAPGPHGMGPGMGQRKSISGAAALGVNENPNVMRYNNGSHPGQGAFK